jgi:hypothetical protein
MPAVSPVAERRLIPSHRAERSPPVGPQASLTRRILRSPIPPRGLKRHGYHQVIATRWLTPVGLKYPDRETRALRTLESA